ncbi:MAG TPA: 16S rRNA (guanine(527)-N(7))-methyltransferase RsmG [Jatrophihabitans sp.]|jgi:16S rRNA (guanine527-N7)-methyltransferase
MSSSGAAINPEPAAPVEPAPASATTVFGGRIDLAQRFAALLCGDGVLRGVIGPREPARIWTRHLLNCAVIGELFEPGLRVVDVGSGAGLPGIAVAIARPDLRIDLAEPLQRRVDFLESTVDTLGLTGQVRVMRGRAEDLLAEVGGANWVCARAVAPLDRLVRWCLPLLGSSGRLALMKGAGAAEELATHGSALRRAGATRTQIRTCGSGLVDPPVTVVTVDAPVSVRGNG